MGRPAAARVGRVELFTSPALLDEFREVLQRPKFAERFQRLGFSVDEFVGDYEALATQVESPEINVVLDRDPQDVIVLACAAAARAEAIVSGDLDLLSLKSFNDIPILSASQLLALLE